MPEPSTPPAFPVVWKCVFKHDNNRRCFVRSKTWVKARDFASVLLQVEPQQLECLQTIRFGRAKVHDAEG